jgi:ribosomal protein S18 acetylase RimI-like enzyme
MARLSNLLRSGDAGQPPDAPIVCRPAQRAEIEHGLRLILAGASGPAGDEIVLDFLSLAVHRRIDVNSMWVAERGGRIVWALLPLVSPGRTMLLLTPGRLFRQTPPTAVRLLSDAVCAHFRGQQIVLAQVLLDPGDRTVRNLYHRAQFEDIAELMYLHRNVDRANPQEQEQEQQQQQTPQFPPHWQLVNYSSQTHALFADTIARSYESSLDCPALNGRRTIDDVIEGHKATGQFDPTLWFALRGDGAQPSSGRGGGSAGSSGGGGRGVLLLNPTTTGDSVELVYLGLPRESRGRGISDQLMRIAMSSARVRGFGALSLAVDSRNAPALRLYYRHGLQRIGSRLALVRDLR